MMTEVPIPWHDFPIFSIHISVCRNIKNKNLHCSVDEKKAVYLCTKRNTILKKKYLPAVLLRQLHRNCKSHEWFLKRIKGDGAAQDFHKKQTVDAPKNECKNIKENHSSFI